MKSSFTFTLTLVLILTFSCVASAKQLTFSSLQQDITACITDFYEAALIAVDAYNFITQDNIPAVVGLFPRVSALAPKFMTDCMPASLM